MRCAKFLFAGILVILFLNLVVSGFSLGDEASLLERSYGTGEIIRGWLNISFDKQTANSFLTSNFGESLEILDFLEADSANYLCAPIDCESSYTSSNPKKTKQFTLSSGQEKIIGLKFENEIQEITSVEFDVTSNAAASCISQFKIDFFDDNKIDLINTKTSDTICADSKTYSCFDNSADYSMPILESEPYCQKIKLISSPGFKVGAWVQKISGEQEIKMSLYDLNGIPVEGAECILPESSTLGGEVFCNIDYSLLESEDYYLCIGIESGSGEYKIKRNTNADKECGFFGYPPKDEVTAYSIFAIGRVFSAPETLEITNNLATSDEDLSFLITNYLSDRYSLDCSDSCIVPIKIISTTPQTISVSGLSARYKTNVETVIEDNFYDVAESPALINSDFIILDLKKTNFSVSDEPGNKTFELKLDSEEILSEKILTEEKPLINYLNPQVTVAGLPTQFTIYTKSNLTNYYWDFGDGEIPTTENKITYAFNSTGTYELKIRVKDVDNKEGSGTFEIVVGNPQEIVNQTLEKISEFLKNITSQIESLDLFEQLQIKTILELDEKESQLKDFIRDYASANEDADYTKIMLGLIELDMPKSIFKIKTASNFDFYPSEDAIDIEILSDITDESVGDSNYVDAVYLWHYENLDAKIDYTEFAAQYEYHSEPLAQFFKLNLEQKESLDYDFYFIIKNIENLKIKQSAEEKYNYKYLEVSGDKIEFSTTEEIDLENLPGFFSPALNELPVVVEKTPLCNLNGVCEKSKGETWRNCDDCSMFWFIFLIAFFLILFFFIIYIILQQWYKRKYETYLFKNRNYLFNIVNFIHNSKQKKLSENEIEKALRKAGWNSEQIAYAMKKYAGKRTGMWEIPVDKIIMHFNKKKMGAGQPLRKAPYGKNINYYRNLNKGFR